MEETHEESLTCSPFENLEETYYFETIFPEENRRAWATFQRSLCLSGHSTDQERWTLPTQPEKHENQTD